MLSAASGRQTEAGHYVLSVCLAVIVVHPPFDPLAVVGLPVVRRPTSRALPAAVTLLEGPAPPRRDVTADLCGRPVLGCYSTLSRGMGHILERGVKSRLASFRGWSRPLSAIV